VCELICVLRFLQVLSGFPPGYLGDPYGCPQQDELVGYPRVELASHSCSVEAVEYLYLDELVDH
jgi:hypothetical protein